MHSPSETRLRMPEPLTAAQSEAAAVLLKSRGHLRGPLGVWLHSAGLAIAAAELGDFLRFRSGMPEDLKEIAILVTATHWQAEHARQAHGRLAAKAGVSSAAIDAMAADRPPPLSGAALAVHDFTRMLLKRGKVDEETYRRVAAELAAAHLVELTGLIGYYSLVSLSLNAFEIPSS